MPRTRAFKNGGVGPAIEHADVVVGFECEDAATGQRLIRLGREHARIGAISQRIARALETESHGIAHVVARVEYLHGHAGDPDRVAGLDQIAWQLCKIASRGDRARRGVEPELGMIAEHRDARHMVGVLVREQKRLHAAHIDAERVRAGDELAPRDAAIDEHRALGSLDHAGVALGSARQDMQMDLRFHVKEHSTPNGRESEYATIGKTVQGV